jgi:uncharacterized protein YndB with AHSA1/START domain
MSSISSTFSTAVHIGRPVDDVFAYVADPRSFSAWNSAVTSVQATSGPGLRYLMHRQLPSGRATNELEIIEREPPTTFTIRTISGPTPFVYRYRFEPAEDGTRLTLTAEVEVSGLASLAPGLAAHAVRRGVDANFATLRSILERG